ncbi:phosphate signaling complex protein PhoU [Neoactinobaculum massilliense]|uniref:phosphate signaling complex protein PhoU n=1 Tax=Neoactinobaculum massilliense TaxID=2364794 RepID=UPI000F51F4B1|nr:phosphate signaling complex protein PhoU [Neoactinobaculum massilliense]
MREEFRREMNTLERTLAQEARSAAKAMKRAASSLEDPNLALAESVIDADINIDNLQRDADEMALSLLARQAPVAGDLRVVVTALRISNSLERMGDLARHVAYIARGRFPERAAEGEGYQLLVRMAKQAATVGERIAQLVESQDIAQAREIEEQDEVLDEMHRKSFEIALDESNGLSRQELVDVVLLGRFLERYGDHGVSVARNMYFLVTGLSEQTKHEPGTEEQVLGARPGDALGGAKLGTSAPAHRAATDTSDDAATDAE